MSFPCLHCLEESSCQLKLDKRGRPYSTCSSCGTRAFYHHRAALRGLQFLAPQLSALWHQRQEQIARCNELDGQGEALMQSLRTQAAGAF